MTEMLEQPIKSNEGSNSFRWFGQYQPQTLTLHNTLGLVFMSILAFALLVALLRQQARYNELVERLVRRQ